VGEKKKGVQGVRIIRPEARTKKDGLRLLRRGKGTNLTGRVLLRNGGEKRKDAIDCEKKKGKSPLSYNGPGEQKIRGGERKKGGEPVPYLLYL